ncbi:delta-lactam-biosynthetic de-N-acetylase [Hydrogenibacillus sp. N12]|uniref:delta-lactam-biosynthetic de-N-acetylase n=1 Tax=Hydrogenibacillus sp. N12 TaxID=2866627 RepID=UPI001C7CB68E|nr:delta-lactam-biosynthetic de-N-acetylase [Hydrogenibacillus sp. N12]QZA34056.1 delta-lactam-biosynthetic de-N-acetylase [Hydrogenibacillus sp. N12]
MRFLGLRVVLALGVFTASAFGSAAWAARAALGVASDDGSAGSVDRPASEANLPGGVETRAYHWGFQKSRDGRPPSIAREGFQALIERYGALFYDEKGGKVLYLTFDNGYENGQTARILDVLKEKNVPATFFVTGHYLRSAPELVRRMVAEGHIVGNHSWSHPDMSALSPAEMRREIERVNAAIAELTPQRTTVFFRPPRGVFSERLLRTVQEMGMETIFWSVAYKDWERDVVRGADYAYRQVMGQLHPGAVILLHSVSKDNADALGRIIDDARAQGYDFRSLEDWRLRERSLLTPEGASTGDDDT